MCGVAALLWAAAEAPPDAATRRARALALAAECHIARRGPEVPRPSYECSLGAPSSAAARERRLF